MIEIINLKQNYTLEEAATYLTISLSTLKRIMKQKQIEFYKNTTTAGKNGKVFFTGEQINNFIEKMKSKDEWRSGQDWQ